jgi:hypothetical protein
MGVPVLTLSTRFLENSRNISSFSEAILVSLIIEKTKGAAPIRTPIPKTKKKNFVPYRKKENMIMAAAIPSPANFIFLDSIILFSCKI